MTEDTLRKLNEAFALGCTDEEACLYADIGTSTLYDYQKANPKFSEQKELLKQRPVLLARQSVIRGFAEDSNLALKFLERKKKDEFSLRQELTGEDNGPIQISWKVEEDTD